jgi:hypothetical protein
MMKDDEKIYDRLHEAASKYQKAFRDSPPLSGLPSRLWPTMIEVIDEAVAKKTKPTEAQFYAALGVEAPPPDALT